MCMQPVHKLRQSGIGSEQQIHCIVLSVVQYSEVCIWILTFTLESKRILFCGARLLSTLVYFSTFLLSTLSLDQILIPPPEHLSHHQEAE